MAQRISRRILASHVAKRLADGDETATAQLAAYLVETHRVDELDAFVDDIENALAQSGIVIADVAGARELTAESKAAITEFIQKEYANVKQVELRESVEPQLIGGVRIKTPDAELDATVRRRLTKLQRMKV